MIIPLFLIYSRLLLELPPVLLFYTAWRRKENGNKWKKKKSDSDGSLRKWRLQAVHLSDPLGERSVATQKEGYIIVPAERSRIPFCLSPR